MSVVSLATPVATALPLVAFALFICLFVGGIVLWNIYRNRRR